jgi:glyoxylase-like metal-dependent hydrolase (beta-lactamase superfamily II)
MIVEKGIHAYLWQDQFENNCNSFILGEDKIVLFDVGHQRHVSHLLRGMEADGIALDSIDLIIITHCHPDHLEAAAGFLNGKTKVTYHREEANYMQEQGSALYQMMGAPLPEIPVEFYVKEGALQMGRDAYEIIHTPGHSPGAICIYWPEKQVIVTGDLIFSRGIGRTDFPGGDGRQLIESIEKVRKLDVKTLLPGHGEILVGKDQIQENFAFIEQSYYGFL